MVNMRMNVVSAVLKIDRPFRAATVVDMVGLERQLVWYHLNELVKEGLLEKTGRVYQINSREDLLDSLVELTNQTSVSKMTPSKTMFGFDADWWNSLAEFTVLGKGLHDELSLEMRNHLIRKIEDTINELKQLRKFVNAAQRSEESAARKLHGKDFDEVYDEFFIKMLQATPSIGKREWVNGMKEKIEKVME